MRILHKIIDAHGRSGVLTHNQLRFSFIMIGPVFMIIGILGLIGHGDAWSNAIASKGIGGVVSFFVFLVIGILSLTLRLTLFRNKRHLDNRER